MTVEGSNRQTDARCGDRRLKGRGGHDSCGRAVDLGASAATQTHAQSFGASRSSRGSFGLWGPHQLRAPAGRGCLPGWGQNSHFSANSSRRKRRKFFFFNHPCGMWRFLGQGSNLSYNCSNARSLTPVPDQKLNLCPRAPETSTIPLCHCGNPKHLLFYV